MHLKIEHRCGATFLDNLEASGGRFRLDVGFIWGVILVFWSRYAISANIAPRLGESTIFGFPGDPKKAQPVSDMDH